MEKNIVWFDLETTGVNTTTDRIIEICMIKTDWDGNIIESYRSLVNPEGVKSRPEALAKHGIADEDLLEYDTFKYLAKEIYEFIGDCHLGGYNVLYFDIPLLVEEFIRAGIVFNHRGRAIIDPFLIQAKYEPRNLEATYKRLTGKTLEGAHRAEADIRATIEIFEKQLEMYDGLPKSAKEIDESVNDGRKTQVDLGGKFIIGEINGNNEILFNFGKWKGQSFRNVYENDKGYIEWMINKGEFPSETKIIAKKLLNRMQSENIESL